MSARQLRAAAVMLLFVLLAPVTAAVSAPPSTFDLQLRRRVPTSEDSPRFHALTEPQQWQADKTAVIVCDMWNLHHCLNATRRVGEMAPRMNQVLQEARRRGALIIHAPSSCMEFYQDHPARRRAQQAPPADNLPEEIGQWCHQIPSEEQGEYPIDQTDGGEDDDPQEHAEWAAKLKQMGLNPRAPWTRQIDKLEIKDEDVISDSGVEIWNVLEQRGIDNVILLGVHTNMCVLGRPFGLRQMARNGKRVVLMRDMTDTMYNPARRPQVSHFTGTDLIVEHIEKWVCPTITSDQLLGDEPFQFAGDQRPHLVIITAEREYRTNESLPDLAAKELGKTYRVSFVHANEQERNDLPGVDVVARADVLLVSVRRRVLPPEQMQLVRQHIEKGKPVVGIRTASHAFSLNRAEPPEGLQDWPEFDRDVIGGHYTGHHGNGPIVQVKSTGIEHPILKGLDLEGLHSSGSLYKVRPLSGRSTPLLAGSIPGQEAEPVAWTSRSVYGGRVFYTSMGHIKDFEQPAFRQLLVNAITWASRRTGLSQDRQLDP